MAPACTAAPRPHPDLDGASPDDALQADGRLRPVAVERVGRGHRGRHRPRRRVHDLLQEAGRRHLAAGRRQLLLRLPGQKTQNQTGAAPDRLVRHAH